MLSPRQDDQPAVSNIKPTCTGSLSSTRYPNRPSAHTARPTGRPYLPHTYHIAAHRHYHQNLRLALRLYLSICRAVLTLFVRITPDIRTETHNSPAGRARASAFTLSHSVYRRNSGKNYFLTMLRSYRRREKKREREKTRCLCRLSIYIRSEYIAANKKREKQEKKNKISY